MSRREVGESDEETVVTAAAVAGVEYERKLDSDGGVSRWTTCCANFSPRRTRVLDTVDNQLVRFEQEPNNAKIFDNIFRLVHTIKGTCGFLGLPRLEALAHAAETLMGKFRDGMPVTGDAVTLILNTIDRIKEILGQLEATEAEPEGVDQDLIGQLEILVGRRRRGGRGGRGSSRAGGGSGRA